MGFVDWAVLILVAGLGLLGFTRGVIREVFELVGAIAGALVAYRIHPWVGEVAGLSAESGWIAKVGVFAVTFVVIMIAVTIVGRLLKRFVHSISLGLYDRLLGMLFGATKGGIVIAVIAAALLWIGPAGENIIAGSKLVKADLAVFKPLARALPAVLHTRYTAFLGDTLDRLGPETVPLYRLASSYTDSLLSCMQNPSIDITAMMAQESIEEGEPKPLHGIVANWDPARRRGDIEYTSARDSVRMIAFYSGGLPSEGDLVNTLEVGKAVRFNAAYFPYLGELVAVDLEPIQSQ